MAETSNRPPVWVGHITVTATDIGQAADFYVSLGMREVERNDRVVVLELRGGTHLVVVGGEPAESASFDLMVEDLDATHARWSSDGHAPSEIERGRIHDTFTLIDPTGTTVKVYSSHVIGEV